MTTTAMTKGERADLASLVRQRAKLMKAAASQRPAELVADVERQLGAIYSFDDDETWAAANAAAKQAVEDAQAVIAERCRELGIPSSSHRISTWRGMGAAKMPWVLDAPSCDVWRQRGLPHWKKPPEPQLRATASKRKPN